MGPCPKASVPSIIAEASTPTTSSTAEAATAGTVTPRQKGHRAGGRDAGVLAERRDPAAIRLLGRLKIQEGAVHGSRGRRLGELLLVVAQLDLRGLVRFLLGRAEAERDDGETEERRCDECLPTHACSFPSSFRK